jgi:hypothetical protein
MEWLVGKMLKNKQGKISLAKVDLVTMLLRARRSNLKRLEDE